MENTIGLKKAEQLFNDRNGRSRELKEQGTKVLGYMCTFAPAEIISAAGFLPFRIMGRPSDDIVEANSVLEPIGCPYVRNCFDQALRGNTDFFDGIVIAHGCDMVQRVYGHWKTNLNPGYSYLFNVPHTVTAGSIEFFEREIGMFRRSLEKHAGIKITDDKILAEIEISNENRAMVKELYELRNTCGSLTGVELQRILVVGMSIPSREFNALLKEAVAEVKSRAPQKNGAPRVLVWGSIIDNPKIYQIIEENGGAVIADDNCIGSKSYFNLIDTSQGPVKGLTKAYFEDFQCSRTYRGAGFDRFEYIADFIKHYNVEGIVCYTYSFCDPHQLDYPDLRDFLEAKGIPILAIQDDYTLGNSEMIANRVQPFIEALKHHQGSGAPMSASLSDFGPGAFGRRDAAASGCDTSSCAGCDGKVGRAI